MRLKRRYVNTSKAGPTWAGALLAASILVLGACSRKQPVPQAPPPSPPVVATVGHGELPPEMAKFAEAIARSRLAYIDIVADKQSDVAPWNSKLGGVAYLPKGQPYPSGPDGVPLALLAQLNFSEMPALDGYPSQGILQFFIAGKESNAHVYGMTQYDATPYNQRDFFASLSKQTWFRLVYHPQVLQEPDKLQHPPVAPNEMMPLAGTTRVRFQAATEPVSIADYRFQRFLGRPADSFFQQFGEKEEAAAVHYMAFSSKVHLAKVGGYSSPVQEDPRKIQPAEDWVVLLELQQGYEKGAYDLMWGDSGMGAFYIRPDDLRRLDFSKVVYYWDNH